MKKKCKVCNSPNKRIYEMYWKKRHYSLRQLENLAKKLGENISRDTFRLSIPFRILRLQEQASRLKERIAFQFLLGFFSSPKYHLIEKYIIFQFLLGFFGQAALRIYLEGKVFFQFLLGFF